MQAVFDISLTLLLITSGVILAASEGGPVAAGTGPIALACLYFVDWKKTLDLPAYFAGVFGIVAFIAATLEFFLGGIDAPLVAAGHLLVYLTWALLVIRKTDTSYWLLMALSVLQMALAVFLSSRVWVGVGLIVYTVEAIWTLSVFHLLRSVQPQRVGQLSATGANGAASPIAIRSGVSRQRHERLLSFSFFGSDMLLAFVSLLVGIVFYLFIPRIWTNAAVPGERDSGEPLTGFTTRVRLGDLGEVLESTAPALSVRLFDAASGLPLSDLQSQTFFGAAPLLRGATQEQYVRGHWLRRGREGQAIIRARTDLPAAIREDFTLQQDVSQLAITYGDVASVELTSPGRALRLESSDEYIYRPSGPPSDTVRYSVLATHSPRDTQFRLAREQLLIDDRALLESQDLMPDNMEPTFALRFADYLDRVTDFPGNALVRLRTLTDEVKGEETNPALIADRILAHLQEGGRYGYTLSLSVTDPTIDPVEDFLFNRKQGHCEYFASAMVLMLRAAGVPARMVVGFKGGVFRPETHTLEVQQLHAHTWVEAYIDGGWRTFDPTPAARDQSVQARQAAVEQTATRLTAGLWNFMVRYSRYDQLVFVYRPVGGALRFVWELVQDVFQGNFSKLKTLWESVLDPRNWFSWGGLIFVLIVAAVVSGIRGLIRRLRRARELLDSLIRKLDAEGGRVVPAVPFYERFLSILKSRGLSRRPSQTAREFVRESWETLRRQYQPVAQVWPAELAEDFYRVRYGGENLTAREADQLQAQLDHLEALLREQPAAGAT